MNSRSTSNCLHLVVRASIDALERCRSQYAEGDVVLFLDDGVMHFAGGDFGSCGPGLQEVCFSAVDLEVRGLLRAARDSKTSLVSDSDISKLLREYDFCLTWK